MRLIYTLAAITLFTFSCSSSKNSSDEKIEVSMRVTTSSDYCGGANPNDRILKELQTPKTYSDKDILVSAQNKLSDSMTTISTNSKGEATVSLVPGTYYVYLPGKAYTNFTAGGNEERCKTWKNTPNATFDIEKGIEELAINVHKTCSPCGARPM